MQKGVLIEDWLQTSSWNWKKGSDYLLDIFFQCCKYDYGTLYFLTGREGFKKSTCKAGMFAKGCVAKIVFF